MTSRRTWRRVRHAGLAVAVALAAGAGLWAYGLRLRPTATLSGWLLAATVVLLALFGVRKRLPAVPLGRASTWLRFHVDVGVVSVAVFVMHAWYKPDAGFQAPNGALEILLASAYVVTAGSGVLGLALSRKLAPRLTEGGDELLFDRLPIYRRDLRERAEALVVDSRGGGRRDDACRFLSARARRILLGSQALLVARRAVAPPAPGACTAARVGAAVSRQS